MPPLEIRKPMICWFVGGSVWFCRCILLVKSFAGRLSEILIQKSTIMTPEQWNWTKISFDPDWKFLSTKLSTIQNIWSTLRYKFSWVCIFAGMYFRGIYFTRTYFDTFSLFSCTFWCIFCFIYRKELLINL